MTRILQPNEKLRRKTEGNVGTPGARFGCGMGSQFLSENSCHAIYSMWRRIVPVAVEAPTYADYYSIFGQREEYPFPQLDEPAQRMQLLATASRAAKSLSTRLAKTPSAIAGSPARLRSYRKEKDAKKKELKNEKEVWKAQLKMNPMAGVAEVGTVRTLSVDVSLDLEEEGPPVPPMPPSYVLDDEPPPEGPPSISYDEADVDIPPPPPDISAHNDDSRRRTMG